jgi:thymidylate synthase
LSDGNLGPIYGSQWRHWPVFKKIDDETLIDAGRELQKNGATNLLDPYFSEIDQISILIDGLKNNPFSRRHILNSWNWSFIPDEKLSPHKNVENGMMSLPPCHMMAQFYISEATNEDVKKYIEYQNKIDEYCIDVPKHKLSCQLYCRSQDLCLGTPFNLVGYSSLVMMLAKQCGYMPGDYHYIIGDAHIYLNHIAGAEEMLSRNPLPSAYLKINNNVSSVFDYKINDFSIINYNYHPAISFDISI